MKTTTHTSFDPGDHTVRHTVIETQVEVWKNKQVEIAHSPHGECCHTIFSILTSPKL